MQGSGKKNRARRVDSHEALRGFTPLEGHEQQGGEEILGAIRGAERPVEEVQRHLRDLCELAKDHTWLIEACMVDYLEGDLWGRVVRAGWSSELCELTEEEVACLSRGELRRPFRSEGLSRFLEDCARLRLDATPPAAMHTRRSAVALISMSEKKSHEVGRMAGVCSALANESKASCVIDVGSGKGYLSNVMALGHGLDVVGIDSLQGNTDSAKKRHEAVSRMAAPAAGARAGTYSAVTGYVVVEEHADGFVQMLGEKTGGRVGSGDPLMMAGLHTCGDLSPTMLRAFVAWSNFRCLCKVGCCYNLLTQRQQPGAEQEGEGHSADAVFDCFGASQEHLDSRSRSPGFPLSTTAMESGASLNRNARNLACTTHRPVPSCVGMSPEELANAYRAGLQFLWVRKMRQHAPPELQSGNVSVGKIAARSKDFTDYIRMASDKLQVPREVLTDEEIHECWVQCESQGFEMRILQALRSAIAPCIESLILLDRLAFLLESKEVQRACLLPLFDTEISPRNFALIAFKE